MCPVCKLLQLLLREVANCHCCMPWCSLLVTTGACDLPLQLCCWFPPTLLLFWHAPAPAGQKPYTTTPQPALSASCSYITEQLRAPGPADHAVAEGVVLQEGRTCKGSGTSDTRRVPWVWSSTVTLFPLATTSRAGMAPRKL